MKPNWFYVIFYIYLALLFFTFLPLLIMPIVYYSLNINYPCLYQGGLLTGVVMK